MPLSRLIGLELLKLHQEKDVLDDNIAQYLVILNNKEELDKTIIARLKRYKKQFGVPRKTELANVSQVKYVEEIKEEDIYVLIDRFGYIKSVDATSYSRLSAETLNDYAHIVCMRNTDRLCVFSSAGNMYQIKAMNIPKGRSRDKGVLIQSLCKIGHEDALLYVDAETLFNSQLLFTTAYGFVKLVSGIEFDTNRLAITSTKLDENDHLAGVTLLTVEDAIAQDRKVIMITKDGLSLGFPLTEVSELKKTSRGVKGIALEKEDLVEYSSVVTPDCEEVTFEQTKYNPKKIRNRKRGAKGQKAQIRLS